LKTIIANSNHAGYRFEIRQGGAGVGYYLFVFEGERCSHDYLQDTIEKVKSFALEEFGVPFEAWRIGEQ
jgi:hypothetical protein